jgi:AraC-like DNA-binding protein
MAHGAGYDVSRASQAVGLPLITELVRFNGSREAANTTDTRHQHPFHQLDIVLDGSFEHVIGGRPLPTSKARDAVLVPPLVRHHTRTRIGCWHASYKIYITGPAADALGQCAFRFRLSRGLFEVVRKAAQAWNDSRPFAVERVLAAAAMAILEAMESAPKDPRQPPQGSAFRRQVLPFLVQAETKPETNWTVAELARKCSVSADHFSRLFRREFGENPKRFILDSRMRFTAALLAEQPDLSIKQIGEIACYSTVQAFSRAFRQAFGTSPAAFRRHPRASRGPSRLISIRR